MKRSDLEARREAAYPFRRPLRVAISGSSGLVGSELARYLEAAGHEVHRLVRRDADPGRGEIRWDPQGGVLDPSTLEGLDAVVHLAGENIASGRWTQARKVAIRESRTRGTLLLSSTLSRLKVPPNAFLCASAVGFYGDRGDEVLTEDSGPGQGFLAGVCEGWEKATEPAREASVRTVNLRLGIVLSGRGGALAKMMPPFRWAMGGRLGTGRQFMSWVSLEELIDIILYCMYKNTISGPVNAVSPEPVTNAQFTASLGRALRRPARLAIPAAAIGLLLGEMGREMLLSSCRAIPSKLKAEGYPFGLPSLDAALALEVDPSSRERSFETNKN